ncbi:alpha/beta fold hydrolase [Rhizobium sp. C4]|uniref:alpha/beta fold hydrolase n=1 Tax=Rhizobium sp. C4 TaxID=1349800 RepID=UPI001E4A82DA|nr:alpha/beta hydrolase [Rhizobium sp. C4]MCD2171967.1 alpha/beta hydrolase [Rhizobium sp. C4]
MTAPYLEHHIPSPDGLTLYARDYGSNAPGAGGRLPVVCLAGLTRNSRDFHPLAVALSTDTDAPRRVITIDTRGRGGSDRDGDPSRYTVPHEAGDVIAVLTALGISRAAFIGTSRGGLILHVLVAVQPQLLGPAILNDVGPAIGMEGLRHIQSYLGRRPSYASLAEAADALKRVHGPAFPKLTDTDWLEFADATLRETEGRYEPDHDPAIAAGMAAVDLSQPLPELWEQFDLFRAHPLMTIRGENSVLLTPEILNRMKERNPEMDVLLVHDQGHAPLLHLDGTPAAIKAFLDRAP